MRFNLFCILIIQFLLHDHIFASSYKNDSIIDFNFNKIDSLFNNWDSKFTPGCAVGIIYNGKLIFKKAYGMSNIKKGIPNTTQTIFDVASISKQFTCMAVLLLEESCQLDIDENIQKYLPYIKNPGDPITIRHLMNHTGGIRQSQIFMPFSKGYFNALIKPEIVDNEFIIERMSKHDKYNFKAGEYFLYSNYAYVLLADIVERVSGVSFHDFTKENIFIPLGMENTQVIPYSDFLKENGAWGYNVKSSEKGTYKPNLTETLFSGKAGLTTTVEDMFLWDQNFYKNKLGKGQLSLTNSMATPGKLNNGKDTKYGFGLFLNEYKGLKTVHHSGSSSGYSSQYLRFPDYKLSIIIFSNTDQIRVVQKSYEIADLILSKHYTANDSHMVADSILIQKHSNFHTAKELEPLAGTYYDSLSISIRDVQVDNNKLIIYKELVPVDHYHFKVPNSIVHYCFEKTEEKDYILIRKSGDSEKVYLKIDQNANTEKDLREYKGKYKNKFCDRGLKIKIKNNELYLSLFGGLSKLKFRQIQNDFFHNSQNSFAIEFIRNSNNEIVGFNWQTQRTWDILFQKES